MKKMEKVIIIGAGVVGCAVAKGLSKYDLDIRVLEKGLDVPGGATTVQGVKFRTSAGFGRCQMGFCGTRIIEILSRETGIPARKIRKFGKNSYYFSGNIKVYQIGYRNRFA